MANKEQEWVKKEGSVATLGDGEGQVKEVSGKLLKIEQSKKYENRKNYILEQPDGSTVTCFGSAFIDNRVSESDIGKTMKFEYAGMDKKTRAKIIEVFIAK